MCSQGPAETTMTDNLNGPATARIEAIGDLSNKVALITGASSGFGRAMSLAYAAAGAYIVNADLTPNPPKADLLIKQMEGSGRDYHTPTVELVNKQFPGQDKPRMAFVECNVTKAASVEAAVAFTVATYGRLDIMVNNAGVAASGKASGLRTHEQDEATFDFGFDINVKGVWFGIKYATAQMLKQEPHSSGDRGWIINLCSIMGLIATSGAAVYCATKGAVLQLTRACALEYAADRIHVNCINPGFADTQFLEAHREAIPQAFDHWRSLHPWGRLAQPEDIAKMAVFLAGPGASFITGAPFVVDGGYIAQ